jgi:hypothetical protein
MKKNIIWLDPEKTARLKKVCNINDFLDNNQDAVNIAIDIATKVLERTTPKQFTELTGYKKSN